MLQCRFKIINMVGLYLTGHFAVAFLPINAVKRAREVKGNSSLQGEKFALVDPTACERHSTPPRVCLCIHVCEHVREVVCVCVQDVFYGALRWFDAKEAAFRANTRPSRDGMLN